MPFDDFTDPFNPPANRRRVPTLSQDQETSLLGGLLEGSLGGLAYLGKLADKTFGARAVRGLLGGRPQELASVLPFSDTLGLTHESDTVHGTGLNAALGLTTPGDTSLENEIAGFGTEVLTDPSMLLGAAVPRAVLGAGNRLAKTAGRASEFVSGGRVNPYTYAGRQLNELARPLATAFDTRVAETVTPFGQDVARTEYTPRLAKGRQGVEDSFASALGELDPYAKRVVSNPDHLQEFNRALIDNAELGAAPATARLQALGFAPPEVTAILNRGSQVAADTRGTLASGQAVGVVSKGLNEMPKWQTAANEAAVAAGLAEPFAASPVKYFPRTAAEWGLEGEFTRNTRDRLSGSSEFQKSRTDELRGLGGTNKINELVRDPLFSGSAREATHGRTDLQVESDLLQMLTGHGPGPVPPAWAGTPWGDAAWAGAQAQAKELSQYLKGLPPQAQEHGLFNLDFLGNARARQLEQVRANASGETVLKALDPSRGMAHDVTAFQASGQRAVKVGDLLQQAGLTHIDSATGNPVALDKIANAYGVSLQAAKSLAVPEDVAKDILRMGQAWKVPESVAPVVDFWDRTVQLFKSGLTSPFPAFHVRNAISGMFNMWRAGVLSWDAATDMFRVLRGGSLSDETAAKLFPGMAAGEATKRFQEMLIANNVAFTQGRPDGRAGRARGSPVPRRPHARRPARGRRAKVRPLGEDVGGFLGGYVPEKGKAASSSTRSTPAGCGRGRRSSR
jgi:hypothetical protein